MRNSELKCKGTEVEFKSKRFAYHAEKEGGKNHTERFITEAEKNILDTTLIKTIRIVYAENPTQVYFTRELISVYKEGGMLGHYLYSFTWKQEEVQL